MNIIMIGPVYPYRGGIAHYTSLMIQELQKKHNGTMVSYKLQYPRILYPRGTQKDYENRAFQIEPTHYLVNTICPFSWFKTACFIKSQRPDLVIVQWWHPFFAPAYWSILGFIKKYCKIIFLCHNVFPHEKFPMQKFLTRMTLYRGNAFIVHSKLDEQDLLSLNPAAKYIRTVLPTYKAFNQTNIDKAEACRKLGLDNGEKILLFFGFVREYKGVKHLLDAMPQIAKSLPDCKLLIVGDILENEKDDYAQHVENTGCRENIIVVNGYVPDSEVENYFVASDLVVLPYESATQSGIVQIAYGFGKPVVATNVGGLPEVVLDNETGYIVPPFKSKELADAIVRFFAEHKAEEFHKNIEREAYKFSWERMCDIVEELVEVNAERPYFSNSSSI